jgi:hypothetical protein
VNKIARLVPVTGLVNTEKGMGNRIKIKILPESIYYPRGETQNLYKTPRKWKIPTKALSRKLVPS